MFERYLLKREFKKKHKCDRSGASVTSWNVSGVHDEGTTLRVAQKIFSDYNNKEARDKKLKKVLDNLGDSENIIHALVTSLSIGGDESNISIPPEVEDTNEIERFEEGIQLIQRVSLLITDNRILVWAKHKNNYYDGAFLPSLSYSQIDKVLYNEGENYLELSTEDLVYQFSLGPAVYIDEKERHEAGLFIAEKADTNLYLKSEEADQNANMDENENVTNHEEATSKSPPYIDESDKEKQKKESWQAHKEATEREPPVQKGDIVQIGILEINHHHSGERKAFGKVEGFNIFVENIPPKLKEGDIINSKIMYFNQGKTSATGIYLSDD